MCDIALSHSQIPNTIFAIARMKITKFRIFLAAAAVNPASAWIGQVAPSRSRHSSTQRDAVTVVADSDRHFTITPLPIRSSTGKAWPTRLVKKVLRRDSSSLELDEQGSATTTLPSSGPDNFMVPNYADLGSSRSPFDNSNMIDVISPVSQRTRLITVEEALGSDSAIFAPDQSRSSPPLARVTAGRAENILATLFHRWTQGAHKNLQVHCDSNSGVIDIVKGIFRADATIQFDKLAFGALRVSRGELKSRRLAINLYKFAPFCGRIPRFPSMFDLEAHEALFTQKDLFESTCIREGLKSLLSRCLENRGLNASNVQITGIKIIPSGKLSISGSATTPFGSKLDFEVRSGLDVSNRGHVLTFPGLEISLSPSVGLFVPVVPPISLDMGHNAQITKLKLSGSNRTLQLSCRVTITPRHTRKVADSYAQDRNAYAASFYFDVGRWLTHIGRFSE